MTVRLRTAVDGGLLNCRGEKCPDLPLPFVHGHSIEPPESRQR